MVYAKVLKSVRTKLFVIYLLIYYFTYAQLTPPPHIVFVL